MTRSGAYKPEKSQVTPSQRLRFSEDVKLVFSFTTVNLVTAMTPIPGDVQEVITSALKECPGALRKMSATSADVNFCTRRILFQDISVHSIRRLVHLSSLLSSPFCTIPARARTFELRLAPLKDAGRGTGHDSITVGDAIADVLEHFHDVQVSLFLDLPWLVSRHMDWGYLRSHSNLRQFVLCGSYPWLQDVADTIPHMHALESLIVDATFKTDLYDHLLENDITFPENLKEISLSPSSLPLLGWMSSLEDGPRELHFVRIKIDGVSWHVAFFTGGLGKFLERYGSTVAHLYFWFEECPDEVYNGASFVNQLVDSSSSI
ncbi:hypothetical protein NMY22_g4408 [Coprinellus aureogranulatus]|nr:hypothetical protein NMY22_g4408 [Coprinellus aureogranulatus]